MTSNLFLFLVSSALFTGRITPIHALVGGETPAIGPNGYCFAPNILNLTSWQRNGHWAQKSWLGLNRKLAWHHWSPEQLGRQPMTNWKPNKKEKQLYGEVTMGRLAYADITPWGNFVKGRNCGQQSDSSGRSL